jgi:hypothetical protein
MTEEAMTKRIERPLLDELAANFVCPACFSNRVFDYGGSEFQGCHRCSTIAAKDRRTTAVYDRAYVAERYDRYPTTRPMSRLRLQIVNNVLRLYESLEAGTINVERGSILDVGYGNGDFIRLALASGWNAYGNDVNPTPYEGVRPVPLPDGQSNSDRYRVITFFDALEHFEDMAQVRQVSRFTDWIIASFPKPAPQFPYKTDGYKHYRPGEHHLYFEPWSLERIFSVEGRRAKLVYASHPEDSIRGKRSDGGPNITTCALRCYDA